MIGKRSSKGVVAQRKFHVKRNDEVEVISGSHRGQKGKVLQVLTKTNRVIVEGVNMTKKAVRRSQNNPQGGFQEREGSIHISNVRLVQSVSNKKEKATA